MTCKNCNRRFYIKRNFLSIFSNEKYYLCDRCYNENKIDLKLVNVPLEDYSCTILSIFRKKHKIDLNFFYKEYCKIFNKFYNKDEYFFFFIDEVDLNYDMQLEALNMISKLNEKNLFVMTFFIKM